MSSHLSTFSAPKLPILFSCLVFDMLPHPGPCLLRSTGTCSRNPDAKSREILMQSLEKSWYKDSKNPDAKSPTIRFTSRRSAALHTRRCHRSKIQLHYTEHNICESKDVWGQHGIVKIVARVLWTAFNRHCRNDPAWLLRHHVIGLSEKAKVWCRTFCKQWHIFI